MQLETRRFHEVDGWDRPLPDDLDSEQTVVMAFGAANLTEQDPAVRDLFAAFPSARMVGCSTAGEIIGAEIHDSSLVVAVARFERARARAASAEIASGSSYAAGQGIGRELDASDLRAVVVVSEGLDVNGSDLVRGIVDTTPDATIVTGGLAGDGDRFDRTWTLINGSLRSGRVAAVGLYGSEVMVGYGSGGGWDLFGPERTITRSEGNVLYELDGRPALDLYRDYLGEQAAGLPASGLLFPLSLRESASSDDRVVRTILAIDNEQRSLTFAGDVPTGHLAQLMTASFDRLVEGAEGAAGMAAPAGGTPLLSIAISCVGRRLIMGERCEDEIEAVLESLPSGTEQVGFYSYGEISPGGLTTCELHNQTMTITTLGERLAA